MKKAVIIFYTFYYTFAMIAFPMCDFSMVKDIPQMFQHCKETEDKDLTAFDFITEHLIDFDCIFDNHDKGNEQKSHQPNTNHQPTYSVQLATPPQVVLAEKQVFVEIATSINANYLNDYSFTHSFCVFRPPIV